jgi:hypothetical protein
VALQLHGDVVDTEFVDGGPEHAEPVETCRAGQPGSLVEGEVAHGELVKSQAHVVMHGACIPSLLVVAGTPDR